MQMIKWLFFLLISSAQGLFAQTEKLGDQSDGNRSLPVHRIKLFDENGDVVKPYHERRLPFSTRETCGGDCHSYETIAQGWHFESGFGENPAGRPGQPWILSDQFSATQIPLSWRGWQGTLHPDSLGFTAFEFVKKFGGFYAGGAAGEIDSLHAIDFLARWDVSGKQEINCLACHESNRGYDPAEYAAQIKKENFRWAATAASGIGQVEGSAAKMPDHYNLYDNFDPPAPNSPLPMVFYEKTAFNRKGEVLFSIQRRVSNEKCYACHSTVVFSSDGERRQSDEDVHISAGLNCIDCHHNGLDHKMNRGFAEEKNGAPSLTCAGCHLGDNAAALAGRLGAPKPQHAGLPPLHFEKLSCATCHSGPLPQTEPVDIKTSVSHRLGTRGVNKSPATVPHIQAPVFLPGHDGKIAPHKMIWPAFWIARQNEKEKILSSEIVRPVVLELTAYRDTLRTGDWPQFSDSLLVAILNMLAAQDTTLKSVGYISGGRLYAVANDSELVAEKTELGRPYAWPLAHDVRPARQSLGVNGCGDCHAPGAPFDFAKVSAKTAVLSADSEEQSMIAFRGGNEISAQIFAFTFYSRPLLKVLVLISSLVLAAILALYALKALSASMQKHTDEELI